MGGTVVGVSVGTTVGEIVAAGVLTGEKRLCVATKVGCTDSGFITWTLKVQPDSNKIIPMRQLLRVFIISLLLCSIGGAVSHYTVWLSELVLKTLPESTVWYPYKRNSSSPGSRIIFPKNLCQVFSFQATSFLLAQIA